MHNEIVPDGDLLHAILKFVKLKVLLIIFV
jgi:hypothetical protein